MPKAPAMGGATREIPGRNFAAMSELPPHFENIDSFWLTHTSGVSETLQSKVSVA